ncbi:DNA-binding response OmpR family regulator [Rhizobium ruizarguesonis]
MSRLLSVEDDLTQGKAIYKIGEARGIAVGLVTTRADAGDLLLSTPFACFMLNLILADGSGEHVPLSISTRPDPRPDILPGHARARERARLMHSGADDFLNKPYALYELFARVYKATHRQHLFSASANQYQELAYDQPSAGSNATESARAAISGYGGCQRKTVHRNSGLLPVHTGFSVRGSRRGSSV